MNYKVREKKDPIPQPKGAYKFDKDLQERFLRSYAETGLIWQSCRVVDVSEETIRRYMKNNIEDFATRFEEARGLYRDKLEAEIHRRAVNGWKEEVYGGKDRDELVGYVTRYSDRLLEFHAKRHIPEYRDKQQLDVNVRGGVIAVPLPSQTGEQWEAEFSSAEQPKTIDAEKK